jgi:hypothetical protein
MYNAAMPGRVRPGAVLVKGVVLAISLELAILALPAGFGTTSVFAALHAKRERLPYSALRQADSVLDVGNLDAMFASHVISDPKAPDEFRVILLGDGLLWGTGLQPEESTPGQLEAMHLTCGGKSVRAYNLSYPFPSVGKDLMILDHALAYQPDMIIWSITWLSLSPWQRMDHPITRQNAIEFYKLGQRLGFASQEFPPPALLSEVWERSRALGRIARYQLYLPIQVSTGLDQMGTRQTSVAPAALSPERDFQNLKPPALAPARARLDLVQDFYKLAGDTPVILINEPMQVLSGVPNSSVRYNADYPRWIYDQYREYLGEAAVQNGWDYLDLWKVFPPQDFPDSPLHLTADAHYQLAQLLAPAILKHCP